MSKPTLLYIFHLQNEKFCKLANICERKKKEQDFSVSIMTLSCSYMSVDSILHDFLLMNGTSYLGDG